MDYVGPGRLVMSPQVSNAQHFLFSRYQQRIHQTLRVHWLVIRGHKFNPWSGKISTCLGTAEPADHNYWARALEPLLL